MVWNVMLYLLALTEHFANFGSIAYSGLLNPHYDIPIKQILICTSLSSCNQNPLRIFFSSLALLLAERLKGQLAHVLYNPNSPLFNITCPQHSLYVHRLTVTDVQRTMRHI